MSATASPARARWRLGRWRGGGLPDRVLVVAALAVRGDQRIQFRDVLLSHLCSNTDLLDLLDSTTVQAVQASIPLPTRPEEIARVLGRLTEACATIPDQYAVPTLVVLAMYSWWHGHGPSPASPSTGP